MLALCAAVALSAGPALAQPGNPRGPSHNASDRARLATSAPGLMASEGNGNAFGSANAPGQALAPGQRRALDRAVERSYGRRQSTPAGRGNRIVRLPHKLAASEAFAFGYSTARGLVPAERPNGGGRLLAVRDELVDIDGESYGWAGRLYVADDPAEPVGSITLIYRRGGDVTGTIQVRTDLYRVEPLGEGLHVLVDVDEDALPEDTPGGINEDGRGTRVGGAGVSPHSGSPSDMGTHVLDAEVTESHELSSQAGASANSSTTQRVLVLYTSAAKTKAGGLFGITDVINESIIIANQSYSNSMTTPRLILVQSREFSSFVEGDEIRPDIDRLVNDNEAKSLRDASMADIVVLLTNSSGYNNGIASRIYTPDNDYSENAYAIVDVDRSALTKTFAHEVGHIQGGRHHPEDDEFECGADGSRCPQGFDYGRGHREIWSDCFYGAGWICGYNRFATVMAYDVGAYTRINHFSDPDVEYQGRRTGRVERDNSRALAASAAAVAAYRPDPLSASIDGPGLLIPGETGTWYANAYGGPAGAPTFRWYNNGVFTGVTTQAYTTQAGFNDFSLRVDVVRGGESASAYRYVTVYENGGCDPSVLLCPGPDPGPGGGFLTAAPEAFALQSVGPNPVAGEGVVTFDVPEASAVAVVLYDVLGREVARPVDREVGAGTHRARFDASALSPGLYVVVMRAGDFTSSRQITVAR